MKRVAGPARPGLPAVCLLMILPSVAYLAARAWTPGDGVLIDLQQAAPDGLGFLIGDVFEARTSLRVGDRLVALDRRSVDEWIGGARPVDRLPRSRMAVDYTVIRAGEVQELEVRLAPGGLPRQSGGNWPSYLFLAYLLLVAGFIYSRRPHLPAARTLLLASSAIFASGTIFFAGLQPSDLLRGWPFWTFIWGSLLAYGFSMGAVVHFSLAFPQRRQLLRKHRWTLVPVYGAVWIPFLVAVAVGWSGQESPAARFLLAMRASGLLTIASVPLALAFMLSGYLRVYDARERRQTRWLLWASSIVAVPWLALSVLPELLGTGSLIPQFVLSLQWLIVPSAFAIAIVRESLFDIDYLINRTLVYSALSMVLVAVYFGVVIALQQVFEALTGQQTPLAIVLSTLLIAAIFNPLRTRIQGLIDRRFYRSRYDAVRALNQLSLEMAQRVELTELSQSVINIVQDSLQPAHVALWVRSSETQR